MILKHILDLVSGVTLFEIGAKLNSDEFKCVQYNIFRLKRKKIHIDENWLLIEI